MDVKQKARIQRTKIMQRALRAFQGEDRGVGQEPLKGVPRDLENLTDVFAKIKQRANDVIQGKLDADLRSALSDAISRTKDKNKERLYLRAAEALLKAARTSDGNTATHRASQVVEFMDEYRQT